MKKLYVYHVYEDYCGREYKFKYFKKEYDVEETSKSYRYKNEYGRLSIFKKDTNDEFRTTYTGFGLLDDGSFTYQTENGNDEEVCKIAKEFFITRYDKKLAYLKSLSTKIETLKANINDSQPARWDDSKLEFIPINLFTK